ncbi:MAG: efflux RND transporter permease subunit [Termitinemataceae bacterium]|nr:MAG: efflux RND transporter permease subunit [Termitinemataceae bacterium]
MKNFIRLCIERPVTIIMFLLSLFLAGIFCTSLLPIDSLPEVSFPRITVETNYPGMGSEEVRSVISIPIEDILSPVKGLKRISSISRSGLSIVILDFKWGINTAQAAIAVRESVDAVYASLPQGAEKPVVVLGSSNDDVHAVLGVRSLKNDPFFERNFCEYELRNRLRRIDNVGNIILSGGDKKEIQVITDIRKAAARRISPDALANMISMETIELPAGNAKEGDLELVVLSNGKPQSVADLGNIVLQNNNAPLKLSDIANIREAPAKKKSIFVYNGKAQSSLEIYRRGGSDPVRLSRDVKNLVSEINKQFKNDIEITLVYDAVPQIISNIINLVVSMALGAIAVVLVLLLFIKSLRYSLLAALSIPVSAAFAIVVLYVCGKSLNSMSLSGLALGIGLVSDTSVIILELMCRSFKSKNQLDSVALSECVAKLSASSFGGAATTAVVFLPVIFLPGALGALFGELSIALVSSVIAGWAYSQFALPVLFKMFFRGVEIKSGKIKKRFSVDDLEFFYRKGMRFSMRNAKKVFFVSVLLCAIGSVLLLFRPASFSSAGESMEIEIHMDYQAGTKIEYILQECEKFSAILKQNQYIESVFCKAGAEIEDVKWRSNPNYKQTSVLYRCMLKKNVKPNSAMQDLQELLNLQKPNAHFSLNFPQDKTESFLGLSSGTKLAIKDSGLSTNAENNSDKILLRTALNAAEKIKSGAGGVGGAGNNIEVSLEPLEYGPEIKIIPHRDVQAMLGITSAGVASVLGAITEGYTASSLEIEGHTYDVRVKGSEEINSGTKNLLAIPIAFSENSSVFLGTVSKIERSEKLQSLARLDRSNVIYLEVTGNAKKKKINAAIKECLGEFKNLSLLDESTFSEYKMSLLITLLLILILLYMTLGAQFESFMLPLIFMVTIPLALAGAGPALTLSGSNLDFGASLGIIVLLGLVVNNGIVLYETCAEKVTNGLVPLCAVYRGSSERVKPVIATTLTTIIVLIPLTFSNGQKSMSAAMIGGCLASTILTLFVIPPIFVFFLSRKKCRGGAVK